MIFFETLGILAILPDFFLGLSICFMTLIFSFITTAEQNKKGSYASKAELKFCVIQVLAYTFFLEQNKPLLTGTYFYGALAQDITTKIVKQSVLIFTIITLAITYGYIRRNQIVFFEYWILVLLSNLAIFFIVQSHDLIALYLSLELQALAFYTLAAFKRQSSFSTEAGLKYIITGSFSSGIFLFGVSIIYGFSGTTNYEVLARLYELPPENPLGITIGIFFTSSALLYKIGIAPFHQWAPDVYEGSPTATIVYFSIVTKLPLMVAIIKILYSTFISITNHWQNILVICGIISLVVSNVGAIYQKKVKRFFVYSTVGHIGFIVLAFATGTMISLQTIIIYMFCYISIITVTWGIITSLIKKQTKQQIKYLDELKILEKENTFIAITFTIIIFSMAGIPPILGFYPKILIFVSLVEAKIFVILFVIITASVIGSFYYLRVIKMIYFEKKEEKTVIKSQNKLSSKINKITSIMVSFSVLVVGLLFINPKLLYITTQLISMKILICLSSSVVRAKD